MAAQHPSRGPTAGADPPPRDRARCLERSVLLSNCGGFFRLGSSPFAGPSGGVAVRVARGSRAQPGRPVAWERGAAVRARVVRARSGSAMEGRCSPIASIPAGCEVGRSRGLHTRVAGIMPPAGGGLSSPRCAGSEHLPATRCGERTSGRIFLRSKDVSCYRSGISWDSGSLPTQELSRIPKTVAFFPKTVAFRF